MKRLLFVLILMTSLGIIGYVAINDNMDTPDGLSFETAFRILGQPVKTLDRSLTRVLGVNAKDERELGRILAKEFSRYQVKGYRRETHYLNQLIETLAQQYNPKNLEYNVYIMQGPPNAFAIAGGHIVVTTGMLDMLETEAQLISILGHEKGHIDLGHCIDHMRIQAKTHQSDVGSFFDWYFSTLVRHTFSKFQENEADQFGFNTLLGLSYDPSGMGQSFALLLKKSPGAKNQPLNPVNDYFKTHPSLNIRAENWLEKAKRWKKLNPNKKYYIGKWNFEQNTSRELEEIDSEWHKN